MFKLITLLSLISLTLVTQEKKPRYTYHTQVLANGKEYHYAIDHSPEAQAKIDAQFGPLQKYNTKSLGY